MAIPASNLSRLCVSLWKREEEISIGGRADKVGLAGFFLSSDFPWFSTTARMLLEMASERGELFVQLNYPRTARTGRMASAIASFEPGL